MSEISDSCAICTESIAARAFNPKWPNGNGAWPIAEGRCCDQCDRDVVQPARIEHACRKRANERR
jgi:hypothetical protein